MSLFGVKTKTMTVIDDSATDLSRCSYPARQNVRSGNIFERPATGDDKAKPSTVLIVKTPGQPSENCYYAVNLVPGCGRCGCTHTTKRSRAAMKQWLNERGFRLTYAPKVGD